MKQIFPDAKIIGFEMNKENFVLAERNTKFYDDVILYNKAVWIKDTTVVYRKNCSYDAYAIINDNEVKCTKELIEVETMCLDSIIKNHNINRIDYLKMDIEGAEKEILESKDLGWMDIVYSMNIEMHLDDEKYFSKFLKIIENKGFNVWKDDKHWSSIFAVRKNV